MFKFMKNEHVFWGGGGTPALKKADVISYYIDFC